MIQLDIIHQSYEDALKKISNPVESNAPVASDVTSSSEVERILTRRGHLKEIDALGLKQQISPMRPLFSGRRVHPFVSESLQQPTGGGSPSCHYFFMPLRWQTSPVEQHFSVSILLILMTRWIFLSQRIRATWLEKESSQ